MLQSHHPGRTAQKNRLLEQITDGGTMPNAKQTDAAMIRDETARQIASAKVFRTKALYAATG
jgi:hypothetical protein